MLKLNRQINKEDMTKIDTLNITIHNLLLEQKMTMRELVDCLMSEPYNIAPSDLDLVAYVFERLQDRGLLKFDCRVNFTKFDIVLVFQANPSYCAIRS